MLMLWKYNKRSGYWQSQRSVADDTAEQWLKTYEQDEPSEYFCLHANRPKYDPIPGRPSFGDGEGDS